MLSKFKVAHRWKEVYFVIMLPKPKLALKGIKEKVTTIDGRNVTINFLSGEKLYEIIKGDKFFYRKLITEIFPEVLQLSQTDKKTVKDMYDDIYGKQ